MSPCPSVAVFDPEQRATADLDRRLQLRGLDAQRLELADTPVGLNVAVVILNADPGPARAGEITALIRRLASKRVPTLVWGTERALCNDGGAFVEWVAPQVGLDELVGKIGTLARYAPLICGFERELQHMQRLGQQLNHYFTEIDQEMRLAGRLQRDFLPRQLLHVPPYRFHAVYRPASWVSGDMYDAFRIDETHIGMFVADAMGHGVAAGLLTMFLRQALVAKRVAGSAYTILTPGEALSNLHTCLVRQKLPNCQFVTAAYGILDISCGELSIARAGHPYALHVQRDGEIREVRTEGSLLGLADIPTEFEETRVSLRPGEKVVLYTDGIEDVFLEQRPDADDSACYTEQLRRMVRGSCEELVHSIEVYLDCREGSLHPADDITVLALQVEEATG